jgi:hypothetical protein
MSLALYLSRVRSNDVLGVTGGSPFIDQALALIDARITNEVNMPAFDKQPDVGRRPVTEATGWIWRNVLDIFRQGRSRLVVGQVVKTQCGPEWNGLLRPAQMKMAPASPSESGHAKRRLSKLTGPTFRVCIQMNLDHFIILHVDDGRLIGIQAEVELLGHMRSFLPVTPNG